MKKTLLVVAAVVLVLCLAIGSTFAWLTSSTQQVVNTFTVGDGIDLELKEENFEPEMVPGVDLAKDPKVTVGADSPDVYVFVKVDESANLDDFISYTVDSAWTALPGVDGVYYMTVTSAAEDQTFSVLEGDKVHVLDTVEQADLDALLGEGATMPTLTFTAYAIQVEGLAEAAGETDVVAYAWSQFNVA